MDNNQIQRKLHFFIVCFYILIFIFITFWLKPSPVSDFLSYWNTAADLSIYRKGGFLVLLYAPFQALEIPAYLAALVVNGLCFLSLASILWLNRSDKWQYIATCVLLFIGVWFSGFSPIVNSEIPSVSFFILGLWLLNLYMEKRQSIYYFSSILLFTASLTIRSQFLFIAAFLLLMHLAVSFSTVLFKRLPFNGWGRILAQFLSTTLILAFCLTTLLELNSSERLEIIVHKRTTLYTGILSTGTEPSTCGRYNIEAIQKERAELSRPITEAFIVGISKIPPATLIQTILCKWNNYIFEYNQSGYSILQRHIRNQRLQTKEEATIFVLLNYLELFSVRILKIVCLLLTFLSVLRWRTFNVKEQVVFILTMSVVLIFFGIHTLLEIQERYVLPPILFTAIALIYVNSGVMGIIKIPEEGT